MSDDKKDLLERPATIRLLWVLLWVVCGLTLVPEFFLHRHPHFERDGMFGYYSLLGFISCAVLILVAKGLSYLLKRNENYYDD